VHGHVQRRAEIERDVRNRREAVQVSQPPRRAAARRVPRERRVNVAIRQHQVIALQQRHDLAFATVGESAACNSEKVAGVSNRRCFPRRVADSPAAKNSTP